MNEYESERDRKPFFVRTSVIKKILYQPFSKNSR